jgi:hypothetical protein
MLGSSRVAAQLVASQEGVSEYVIKCMSSVRNSTDQE